MLKGYAERKGGNLENVNEQPLHLYSLQITLPERSASNTVTCGILVAVSLALASLLPLAHRWHGPTNCPCESTHSWPLLVQQWCN